MSEEDNTFAKYKMMKYMIDYMKSELIITPLRAKRLKNDVRKWWFIKTKQADKMQEDRR